MKSWGSRRTSSVSCLRASNSRTAVRLGKGFQECLKPLFFAISAERSAERSATFLPRTPRRLVFVPPGTTTTFRRSRTCTSPSGCVAEAVLEVRLSAREAFARSPVKVGTCFGFFCALMSPRDFTKTGLSRVYKGQFRSYLEGRQFRGWSID